MVFLIDPLIGVIIKRSTHYILSLIQIRFGTAEASPEFPQTSKMESIATSSRLKAVSYECKAVHLRCLRESIGFTDSFLKYLFRFRRAIFTSLSGISWMAQNFEKLVYSWSKANCARYFFVSFVTQVILRYCLFKCPLSFVFCFGEANFSNFGNL